MNNKMSGLVFLVIGLGLMLAAHFDLFKLGGVEPGVTSMLDSWAPLRLVMLAVGALVGVLGCYMLIKKSAKPA